MKYYVEVNAMILVTGATGTVGTEVCRQLVDADIDFRAMIHQTQKPDVLEHPTVQIVYADYENPGSIRNAVENIDSVFLLTRMGPDGVRNERMVVDAAIDAGVEFIVKLSVLGASPFSPISIIRDHWFSEKYIEHSGLDYTFVRPNWFMQNLLRQASEIASEGKIYASVNDGRISMIDARDIASVSVALLRRGGYEGEVLELTGPDGITYDEVAQSISEATGRNIEYVGLSLDQSRESMKSAGLPDWLINDSVEFQGFFSENYASLVTPFVALVTGKEPIPFSKFARDYASEFRGEQRAAA